MKHRRIVILGVVLFVLMGLFPPWIYIAAIPRGGPVEKPAGYYLLFDPPAPEKSGPIWGVRVDVVRLLVQWAVVGAFTGAFFLRRRLPPVPRDASNV